MCLLPFPLKWELVQLLFRKKCVVRNFRCTYDHFSRTFLNNFFLLWHNYKVLWCFCENHEKFKIFQMCYFNDFLFTLRRFSSRKPQVNDAWHPTRKYIRFRISKNKKKLWKETKPLCDHLINSWIVDVRVLFFGFLNSNRNNRKPTVKQKTI